MSIAVVFDGFILYIEFNMEMCVEISDKIWRLHALFSVTDVTLNWAAVNFIKSAFHPELYYMAHLHRLELIISDLNPFWLAVIVRISHGYAWILLKQNGMGPFSCVYIFSHRILAMLNNNVFGMLFFEGMWIFAYTNICREKKKIYPIWLSVVCCYTIHFFPSIISYSRFIFNNRISMPYNFPCILFFFLNIWIKRKLLLIYQYFFQLIFSHMKGPLPFQQYIFLNSTFYARYNTKNDSAIRDLFTEQKQFNWNLVKWKSSCNQISR